MTYPYHYKVVLAGEHISGDEIWSTSFALITDNTVPDPDLIDGALDWLEEELGTRWGDLGVSNQARLSLIKLNLIGPDGKYVDEANTFFRDVNIVAGPAGSLPLQISTVVSLRTSARRGYATHGRMYLPYPPGSSISNGRFGPTYTGDTADAWATLFADFNDVLFGLSSSTAVGIVSGVGEGTDRAVTRVLVGDVPDTQRRRRNALKETYAEVAV